jgi:hypothetical protein
MGSFLLRVLDPALCSPSRQIRFFGLLFQMNVAPTDLLVALACGMLANCLALRPFWARAQIRISSVALTGLGSTWFGSTWHGVCIPRIGEI